jgi:uncharacterized protein (DUF2147 family)
MKKLASLLVFSTCLLTLTSLNTADPSLALIGTWESEEKNLQIEMYRDSDGYIAGRMIYFKCASDSVMRAAKDIENPNEALTDRNLLGLTLVTSLEYLGAGVWDNGNIYDPNSGHTFEARIQTTNSQSAVVRGYWKFKWLGRSMNFKRIK